MTPRELAEMERLKGRVRILEKRNSELVANGFGRAHVVRALPSLPKAALDRLIWLTNTIEDKPVGQMFIQVRLSAADARCFRSLVERLVVAPPTRV